MENTYGKKYKKSNVKPIYWNLGNINCNAPEYLLREEFAVQLHSQSVNNIIKKYVYHSDLEMIELVNITRKYVLKDVEFNGVGLELGAGTGLLSSVIAQNNSVDKIYAIEIIKNMVDLIIPKLSQSLLDEKAYKIIPVNGSFDKIYLKNESIDFITEIGSLHHSSNLLRTLKESHRVLKKNGFIICYDRCHNNNITDQEINDMLSIKYSQDFLIANNYPKDIILTRAENGEHEIRKREWEAAFSEAGFKIKCIKYFITPSLKNFFKAILFTLPYSLRKHITKTVNMGNYEVIFKYIIEKYITKKINDVIKSPISCTVFYATKE